VPRRPPVRVEKHIDDPPVDGLGIHDDLLISFVRTRAPVSDTDSGPPNSECCGSVPSTHGPRRPRPDSDHLARFRPARLKLTKPSSVTRKEQPKGKRSIRAAMGRHATECRSNSA
jgi:hypothetical protein